MGFSGKGAMTGAMTGAGAGATFGPLGALIGGVGGLIGGGLGFGGDVPNPDPYSVDPGAGSAPYAGQWFGPGGGGRFWTNQAAYNMPGKGYVGSARETGYGSRQAQWEAMQQLGAYARGDKSAARKGAQVATERARAQIESQAASTPGGWNPAVQRAAIMAQAGAGQQVAGQTAYEAAREQMAAQQAYLQAAHQMRQMDLGQQVTEQQWFSQQHAAEMAYLNAKSKYLQLGLTDREADRQARLMIERMKQDAYESWAARETGVGQSNRDYWSKMFMGGMGALSGGLESYAKLNKKGGSNEKANAAFQQFMEYFGGGED